jgi:hypothetical protein
MISWLFLVHRALTGMDLLVFEDSAERPVKSWTPARGIPWW